MLFEFGCGDPDRARALYGEYRRCGGPGRIERRGDFSMTIAQLGHITEISCLAWLDPADRTRSELGRRPGSTSAWRCR